MEACATIYRRHRGDCPHKTLLPEGWRHPGPRTVPEASRRRATLELSITGRVLPPLRRHSTSFERPCSSGPEDTDSPHNPI